MKDLQLFNTTALTMTSLEIVDIINDLREEDATELQHSDFMKKVVKVLGEEGAGKFSSSYFSVQNKRLPCYLLPKRESCLMVMSENYKIQAAVFDKWQELEKEKSNNQFLLPTNYLEAVQMLAVEIEHKEHYKAIVDNNIHFPIKHKTIDEDHMTLRDINKLYPFLHSHSIITILSYYVTTKVDVKTKIANEEINHTREYFLKNDVVKYINTFIKECDIEISKSHKTFTISHPCLFGHPLQPRSKYYLAVMVLRDN